MSALLATPLRRWLLLAVGIPLGAWALERVANEIEERKGDHPAARGLRAAGDWLGARRRL
jgi:hypothetical protein